MQETRTFDFTDGDDNLSISYTVGAPDIVVAMDTTTEEDAVANAHMKLAVDSLDDFINALQRIKSLLPDVKKIPPETK